MFRHLGKFIEIANLDRRLGLCARRHHHEAPKLDASLYKALRILSLNLFEKTPLDTAISLMSAAKESAHDSKRLILFTECWRRHGLYHTCHRESEL